MPLHKPLIFHPKELRPLAQKLWDIACDRCNRRQSRWELPDGRKGTPLCSMCWLYESEWAKPRREDLDMLIREVEIETGEKFRRQEDGRLWSCADADRILGAIAVTSRIALYQLTGMFESRRVEDES